MYVVAYLHRRGLKVGFNQFSDPKKKEKSTHEMRYPGDPLPEADGWKDHVLNANIKLGWVQTEAEYKETKAKYESEKAETDRRRELKKSVVQEKPVVETKSESAEVEKEREKDDSEFKGMSKPELIALCKERGLAIRGNKPDLISRLTSGS